MLKSFINVKMKIKKNMYNNDDMISGIFNFEGDNVTRSSTNRKILKSIGTRKYKKNWNPFFGDKQIFIDDTYQGVQN